MDENRTSVSVQQHSILESIVLHLLPGVLILAAYIIAASFAVRWRPPLAPLVALSLAIVLVLIPFELGYLFYQGKKKNNKLSLKDVVLYQERLPFWQYVVFVPILLIWAVFCFGIISPPVEHFLIRSLFSWLPSWLIPSPVDPARFSTDPVLGLVALLSLVLQGVGGPIVEELYFRGYLLPRISYLKGWAPLVNVVLFSLYHFFTPWQNPARVLALLPVVYVVQWRRNIYLSIVFHLVLNVIGPTLIALLGGGL
jgi:hypothetical protein